MKKTYVFILFLLAVACIVGCNESDGPTLELEGIWIEQADRSDTISFRRLDGSTWLLLRRGREIVDGHELPKYGSGFYNFEIKGDSISMLSLLSSCSYCYENFYFKMKGQELHIGDFYKKNSASPLTFVKQQ